MREGIKIFLGRGDGDQVDVLAARRSLEGWIVAADSNDPEVREVMRRVGGRRVEVQGARAGLCVANVVVKALEGGAAQVVVDLNNVFWDGDDDLEDTSMLRVKANALGIIKGSRDYSRKYKHRLTVLPESVWEAVEG